MLSSRVPVYNQLFHLRDELADGLSDVSSVITLLKCIFKDLVLRAGHAAKEGVPAVPEDWHGDIRDIVRMGRERFDLEVNETLGAYLTLLERCTDPNDGQVFIDMITSRATADY